MTIALLILFCVPLQAVQQDYRALVDAYRRNGAPQIEQLLRLPIEQAQRQVAAAVLSSSQWSWEEQRAGAIFHTEAALRLIASKNLAAADEHLQLAQRLLAHVADRVPAQDDFAWRWHQVVSPLVTELGARGLASRLNAYASARWGKAGARQAFLRGVEAEWRGNVQGRVLSPGQSGTFIGPDERREHWFSTAADAFAEALRGDPHLKVAALHLGRIRMLQGKRTEAADLLTRALDDVDPGVGYLAALFLGSIEERDGRFDAAEKWYRQAAVRLPYGQAAPLAIAELLSRMGRDEEGRTTLAARLGSASPSIDPLWTYVARIDHELATRFDLLRVEVWR